MVTQLLKDQNQKNWPWWRWVMIGLNILALVLSIVLSWHSLAGGTMAGCDGESSCGAVLNSRWSMIAGLLPVSGVAVGVYLSLLIAIFYLDTDTELQLKRLLWGIMIVFSGAIFGSALWFTIVQKWLIASFCIYCITTHTTGFLLSILIMWRINKERVVISNEKPNSAGIPKTSSVRIIKLSHTILLAFTGLTLTALLAASQLILTPSSSRQYDQSKANIPETDYHNVPIIGSPDAPYKVTMLFDYQCPHCQKIHLMLDEAIRIYDNKLAFILCPTPLEKECNPYITKNVDAFKNSCEIAKISMAVWLARRDVFHTFENQIFSFDSGNAWKPGTLEDIRAKAIELVGKEKFDAALSDPWIEKYIQNSISIFGHTIQNGKGGIPKLIYGSSYIIPEPYNVTDFIMIIQQSLGMPKP